jgi:hypothetical protein
MSDTRYKISGFCYRVAEAFALHITCVGMNISCGISEKRGGLTL